MLIGACLIVKHTTGLQLTFLWWLQVIVLRLFRGDEVGSLLRELGPSGHGGGFVL